MRLYFERVVILPNSRFQILPLIENLEWPYIWGVVCLLLLFVCTPSSIGRLVGRSVGWSGDLRIGG